MKLLKKSNSSKQFMFLKKIRLSTWIIIGILLLSCAVRIIGIAKESYWLDEAISVKQAQASSVNLIELVKVEMHMPLYLYLSRGWNDLFGVSEFSLRMLSLIFGVLAVYVIFLLGKRMFNERVGIYSALLLALSPIAIYYSQEARLYTIFMFIVLLSFYMFISYLKYDKFKYLLFYLLVNILMLYTNIFAFVVLGIQALWVLFKNRKYLVSISIAIALSILALMPIILNILLNYSNYNYVEKNWMFPSIDKIWMMLVHYASGILIFFIIMFVVIFGLRIYLKKSKFILKNVFKISGFNVKSAVNVNDKSEISNSLLMLFFWVIVPIIFVWLLFIVQPLFHERYLLFTLPAYILLLAFSISQFKSKYRTGIIFVLVLFSIYAIFVQYQTVNKDDWRTASEFLKNNVKPTDYLLINPYYQQDPLTYYYNYPCFNEAYSEHCNFVKKNIITINIGSTCCNYDTKVVDNNNLGELISSDKNTKVWLIENREKINNNATPYNYLNIQKKLISTSQFDGGFDSKIIIYEFE